MKSQKKGLAGRFCSTEGCIFGALALWLQKPLQWDFVSVRKKKKLYVSTGQTVHVSYWHPEAHLTTIIVTAASLEGVRVKLHSSRVAGFPWPELQCKQWPHCIRACCHWNQPTLKAQRVRDWFLSWIILDWLIRWVPMVLLVNLCQITKSHCRWKEAN